jgi:hypothetical protein
VAQRLRVGIVDPGSPLRCVRGDERRHRSGGKLERNSLSQRANLFTCNLFHIQRVGHRSGGKLSRAFLGCATNACLDSFVSTEFFPKPGRPLLATPLRRAFLARR